MTILHRGSSLEDVKIHTKDTIRMLLDGRELTTRDRLHISSVLMELHSRTLTARWDKDR